MHFREVLGKHAMDYKEFRFWMDRFYRREFDLGYEGPMDFEAAGVDFNKFEKYLEIIDRAQVRRTSKAFRALIDSQPLFLQQISFRPENFHGANSWRIEIRSNSKKIHSTIYTDNQQNEYPIEAEFQSRLADREDYRERAVEDLKLIIQTPKIHSEHLYIKTGEFSLYDCMNLLGEVQTQDDVLDGLASVINPSAKPRIKSIYIKAAILEPIVNFLSFLEPGYIESISLDCGYTHGTGLAKMLESEQFKQAKDFNFCSMNFPGSIRDLLHLDSFSVQVESLSVENFRILREVAFKSSTFQSCRLDVHPEGQFEFDGIRRELDDPLVPSIRQNEFRYLIPNTKDCFEITINTSGISVTKKKDYREEDRRQMEMRNNFHRLQM
ncbi:hypothetical protein CAEBREN_01421 [Caenorhabditis brenneri]|uniref:DUF38 domain-containing protein n=1 Tax=Caenorhabditis brenneri TaxID=135651 RepID=G0P380_CAEBE|nr:hypothetical protein CAEBREN_01421 [Caenorhabditis brenneri]